jgi:cell division protein FtsL
MLRIINLAVVAALVAAAAWVYSVKYEATLHAERIQRLKGELRRERERIDELRAEWTSLAKPERIQQLATRHTPLKPLDVVQFDDLANLPDKPRDQGPDPIAAMIDQLAELELTTGSVPRTAPVPLPRPRPR